MISAKQACIQATPRAEALLSELLGTSFDVLAALPELSTLHLEEYGKPTALTTYRDKGADGSIRVVVQLAVSGWLGSARFWVQGFNLKKGGVPVRLSPEQLYDFH